MRGFFKVASPRETKTSNPVDIQAAGASGQWMRSGRISEVLAVVVAGLLVQQCRAGTETCSGGGCGRRAGALESEQGRLQPEGGLARLEAAMRPQDIEVYPLFRRASAAVTSAPRTSHGLKSCAGAWGKRAGS